MMAWIKKLGQVLLVLAVVSHAAPAVGAFRPYSDANKEAAKQLFVPRDDGSYGSLKDTYQALRSLQAVRSDDYDAAKILKTASNYLIAPSLSISDVYYGLKTIELLHGPLDSAIGEAVTPVILSATREAKSLLDLHFAVGALATLKKHYWSEGHHQKFVPAVSGVLSKVKALGEGDGTWRYEDHETDSSAEAAGLAFGITARVIDIVGLEGHKSEIKVIKTAVSKLFDNIKGYDDGARYFDENRADKYNDYGGALVASAVVLRGVAALASVVPDGIKVKEDKFVGLASFFLSNTADNTTTAYYQLDALSILEDNRLSIPLAIFLPSSVLSLTSHDMLEVSVTTVLGHPAPGVSVKLINAHAAGKKSAPVLVNKELRAVEGGHIYALDFLSEVPNVGKFDLNLEVKPLSSQHSNLHISGPIVARVITTGAFAVSDVILEVLDSDTGSSESVNKLDFVARETAKLAANHLQKLKLSFELTTPGRGGPYQLQQVFFKLVHETGVEHLHVVKRKGKLFELTLDFLGLVEQLYYLSGTYHLRLIVGDVIMENSFLWTLGSLELDLPDAPEGAAAPPLAEVDVHSKFGPQPEITHIFRAPEKRPAPQLSYFFLALTLLPLLGFFSGLAVLGTNLKNFPTSGLNLLAAVGFHIGIASILTLYFFFWLKLNLFTTLKAVGVLGFFTSVAGYVILSHLADLSSKTKTA